MLYCVFMYLCEIGVKIILIPFHLQLYSYVIQHIFAPHQHAVLIGKINESGNKKQEVVGVNEIYIHRFLKPIKLKNLHKNGIKNKKGG